MSLGRYGKLLLMFIDMIATAIENTPPKIGEERLRAVLGPRPSPSLPPGRREAYCYECATSHLGIAKVTLREALERFDRGGQNVDEVVKEKVWRAYEELLGAEDDLRAVSDRRIVELHNKVEDVRKWLYRSGTLAEPTREAVAEALRRVSAVSDEVHKELEVRKERFLELVRRLSSQSSQSSQPSKAPSS